VKLKLVMISLKLEAIRIKPAEAPSNLATRRFKLAAER
jgi:hypothetical protein